VTSFKSPSPADPDPGLETNAEAFEDLAVNRPDLSRVDEIGFTDLVRGMPTPTDRCDHLVILSPGSATEL
jgi:hypothetical protein